MTSSNILSLRADTPIHFAPEEMKRSAPETSAQTRYARPVARRAANPPPVVVGPLAFLAQLEQLKPQTIQHIGEIYFKCHGQAACAHTYNRQRDPLTARTFHDDVCCKVPCQDGSVKTAYTICELALTYLAVKDKFEEFQEQDVRADKVTIDSLGTVQARSRIAWKSPSERAVASVKKDLVFRGTIEDPEELSEKEEADCLQALFNGKIGLSDEAIAERAIEKGMRCILGTPSQASFAVLLEQEPARELILASLYGSFPDSHLIRLASSVRALNLALLEEAISADPLFCQSVKERLYKKLSAAEKEALVRELFAERDPPVSAEEAEQAIKAHLYDRLSPAQLADLLSKKGINHADVASFVAHETFKSKLFQAACRKTDVKSLASMAMKYELPLPPQPLTASGIKKALKQQELRRHILQAFYTHASSQELVKNFRQTIIGRKTADLANALIQNERREEEESWLLGTAEQFVETVADVADAILKDELRKLELELNRIYELRAARAALASSADPSEKTKES